MRQANGQIEATTGHDLRTAIMRASRRIKQSSSDDRTTDGQTAVLIYVLRRGPVTPGELSDHQRVSAPSMNRTINALVEAGFVQRVPSADDRRSVLISLTEEGRTLVEDVMSRRNAWIDLALARLEEKERALIVAALPALGKLSDP